MIQTLTNSFLRAASLSWLTGPIFDKELRVSSRRRRNYWLRVAYLALMAMLLMLFWRELVPSSGSGVYRVSRMARAGQNMVCFLIWFQFCATQIVAVVMLSTAVSDEVYHKTLGVLMTTPINSFQIVMGKLCSKLLQLVMLIAISLPLLAIVRVFGGVPWQFLIAGLSITLSTAILFASISLFYSILSKRAYVVIILTIITVGVIFALIPFLSALVLLAPHILDEGDFFEVLRLVNPYFELGFQTEHLYSPRGGGVRAFTWILNCLIMLASAGFVLMLSMSRVRRLAVGLIAGQAHDTVDPPQPITPNPTKTIPDSTVQYYGTIRSVGKHAALWKEMRMPLFARHKTITLVTIFAALFVLSITYLLIGNDMDDREVQMLFVLIFAALGSLFSFVIPATCITSEKEARSWPLLMATTLTESQILYAKLLGVIRRSLPAWTLLFVHVLFFSFLRVIHPVAVLQLLAPVSCIILLSAAAGIYFSSRCKRTTTAVIMNLTFAVSIWLLIPLLTFLFCMAMRFHDGETILASQLRINPFVHLIVIIEATARRSHSINLADLRYGWPSGGESFLQTNLLLLVTTVIYVGIAALFAYRAARRFRRNIF